MPVDLSLPFFSKYINKLKGASEIKNERVAILDKSFIINEELNNAIKGLELIEKKHEANKDIL